MKRRKKSPGNTRGMMYQNVADRIVALIEKKKLWNSFLTPERDLARTFRVSRETVRRALDLLLARGLVSRSQGRGTLVLPRVTRRRKAAAARIAVVSFEASGEGSHAGNILTGIADRSAEQDWLLSFVCLVDAAARQRFFDQLSKGRFDGVILRSCVDRELLEELLRLWGGPIVLVDHSFDDIPITSVRDDSEGGARQAMLHLLSLGHRRIGYVQVSRPELNPWRYAGYTGALRDAGIKVDDKLVAPAFGSYDAGRRVGEELLAVKPRPTAVLAFDDLRAWGVWRAAEALEIEVGTELALAGYGDLAAQNGFPEELTSIRFDTRRIGSLAVEKLAELLDGSGRPGELCLVPTELVARSSTEESRT